MGNGTRGSSIRFEDEVLSTQNHLPIEPNFNNKMPKTDCSSAIIAGGGDLKSLNDSKNNISSSIFNVGNKKGSSRI